MSARMTPTITATGLRTAKKSLSDDMFIWSLHGRNECWMGGHSGGNGWARLTERGLDPDGCGFSWIGSGQAGHSNFGVLGPRLVDAALLRDLLPTLIPRSLPHV